MTDTTSNTIISPVSIDTEEGKKRLEDLVQRKFEIPSDLEDQVKKILAEVRARGDEALIEFIQRFDAPSFGLSDLVVTQDEIEQALSQVEKECVASLEKAASNIEEFHSCQMPRSWFITKENGTIVGQRVCPVDSAGLYVPGGQAGKTPLVSSVLMNSIPAKIAGVKRIVMATPPGPDGKINPHLLVAANLVGISKIYKMGSAWAIAALAFGTETIRPVDVIVGPGNIFVTIAKKLVSGLVGIDMVAGPSEILIISDEHQDPAHIAADLLSQAEHDPMATAVLITTSKGLAEEVVKELELQLSSLPRAKTAMESLSQNGLILIVKDLSQAVEIANSLGPEHLEVLVKDPWSLVPVIRHAGAVFLGPYSPEPIGDYIAGPNHVLPTMGTARFSSALGVETFIKRTSILSYSKKAFNQDAQDVIRLAKVEGLMAHAASVKIRLSIRN